MARFVLTGLLSAALWLATNRCAHAQATPSDHVYVVSSRDTLSAIAQHLGVTTHALASRNHLSPPYALRVGRRLRLPSETAPEVVRRLPPRDALESNDARPSNPDRSAPTSTLRPTRPGQRSSTHHAERATAPEWGRVRHRGFVRLVREANEERLQLNLRHVTPHGQRRMTRFLRSSDGRQHAIHPRLLRLLAIVSDHFGGRELHVVSGFRPFRRGQWTAHSNHNIGNAIDFRVANVPNRTVRNFCRTFVNVGCGYYPRSVFVHMDVRQDQSATWVDWSRPGQRPAYGREDRPPPESSHAHASPTGPPPEGADGADEGVDDVAQDNDRLHAAQPDPNDERPSGEGTSAASATPAIPTRDAGAAP